MKDISGREILYSFDDGISERNFPVMAGSGSIIDEIKKQVIR